MLYINNNTLLPSIQRLQKKARYNAQYTYICYKCDHKPCFCCFFELADALKIKYLE